jgi:hypothetical protein
MGGVCRIHVRRERYIKFLSENLMVRDHSEGIGADGRIILEWIMGKWDVKVWTGCIWLSIGTRRGLL